MEFPEEFYNMVNEDINRLSVSNKLDHFEKLKLHREIDGRYQACIKDWYSGLWGMRVIGDTIFLSYNIIREREVAAQENLDMMKAKLEAYKYQMNAVALPNVPVTQVNVTTNLNLTITFEQARSQIEEMDSLTNAQTKEALDKIDQIEQVLQSPTSKKSKWEQVKPVLVWLADKSFELAKVMLPLLLKIQQ